MDKEQIVERAERLHAAEIADLQARLRDSEQLAKSNGELVVKAGKWIGELKARLRAVEEEVIAWRAFGKRADVLRETLQATLRRVVEADLKRNVILPPNSLLEGEWTAVPREDLARLHAALADARHALK